VPRARQYGSQPVERQPGTARIQEQEQRDVAGGEHRVETLRCLAVHGMRQQATGTVLLRDPGRRPAVRSVLLHEERQHLPGLA
jgi:hypothetical protein